MLKRKQVEDEGLTAFINVQKHPIPIMINKFTTSSKAAQLNDSNGPDNEHLLELTTKELSELNGGLRGVVGSIGTEALIEIGKAIWATRSSSDDRVTTYDCPPGGYHAA